MKAGKSSDIVAVLPSRGDERLGGLEGVVVGGDAADQLDELHARHRIHEMDADEALGMVGHRGEPGDRDRRGIGGDDRVGLEERAQAGENLALDLLVLGRRLDDQVAVGELVVARRATQMRSSVACAPGLVDLALGDLARQQAVDRRQRRPAAAPRRRRSSRPRSRPARRPCAMPEPIWPAPITPTFRSNVIVSSNCATPARQRDRRPCDASVHSRPARRPCTLPCHLPILASSSASSGSAVKRSATRP